MIMWQTRNWQSLKPGNVTFEELQATAPIEFYTIMPADMLGPNSGAQAVRSKIISHSDYFYVWTYAQHWRKFNRKNNRGDYYPEGYFAYYRDLDAAKRVLMEWRLRGDIQVYLDGKLL